MAHIPVMARQDGHAGTYHMRMKPGRKKVAPGLTAAGPIMKYQHRSRWWELVRNMFVAGVVVAAFWLTVEPPGQLGRAPQLGMAAAALVGVACAVRLPRSGVIVSALATGTAWLYGLTFDPFVLTGVALFTVAERRAARLFPRVMLGSVFLLTLIFLALAVEGFEAGVRSSLLSAGVLAASWVLGARTRQVRREAAVRSRAEERLRLARDVHDVLSHSLATIGVRAGASAHVKALSEESLREALRDIEEGARAGMDEMNALLGRERDGVPDADLAENGEYASSFSLAQTLADVAHRAEGAGLGISLELTTELDSWPPTVRSTIHRVVQEALTNVVRHSSASEAVISVRAVNDDIEIQVSDDGTGRAAALIEGHGLVGMRERASALGGRMMIQDNRAGGIAVTVTLPLHANARRGLPR